MGYNRKYIAKRNEYIAIVQAGYADGIPLELSNYGKVRVLEKTFSIIGKVSMDLVAIKTGRIQFETGELVTFWGGKINSNRLENISSRIKKIPYSILTNISDRVIREYINE